MADDGERRMLFDTRGRRKNVIRVVYAILALLMAGSLFLVVGPFNLGELVGGQSGSSAAQVLDEQAERIEGRLAKEPKNEALLLALTRTRISAGNAQIEVTPGSEPQPISADAKDDFERASQAWSRYLNLIEGEPNPTVAQLVAGTFFRLAETTSSVREAEENVERAAEAQRIAAKERPSVGSLSTLAIYEFFNGNFEAGNEATRQAAEEAPSKAEAKSIEAQMNEYRKNAKQFQKRKRQLAKLEKEAGGGQQNPFELPSTGGSLAE